MAEDNVQRDEEYLRRPRWSNGLIAAGMVLLLMDFLVVWFTYMSIKDGSNFWVWWVVVQGLIGAGAVLGGTLYRSRHVS